MTRSHSIPSLIRAVKRMADPATAAPSARFFKCGPGEYSEGDHFLGISNPVIRKLAKENRGRSLPEVIELLQSPHHEIRVLAVLIWVYQFPQPDPRAQKAIYQAYLRQSAFINNWDIVDLSAHHVVGAYLLNRSRAPLRRLAKSSSLWERRISIIATFAFIREDQFDDTLAICQILLEDPHDLIHKATGWMLREVGKRDMKTAEAFLDQHVHVMPRTMLRYAIERFPESRRQSYLKRDRSKQPFR